MADEECAINNKNKIEETFYCHESNGDREKILEDEEEDEELVTEIHSFDDENTGTEVSISQIVELETPLESTSSHGITSVDSGVKPKRLSDEFSNDDNNDDDEDDDEVDASETPLSSKDHPHDFDENSSNNFKNETSCISLCFNANKNNSSSNNIFVQSIDDAIERADFEQEQKLTGGIIIRASALASTLGGSSASSGEGDDDERLNFDLISKHQKSRQQSRSDNVESTSSASSIVVATSSESKSSESSKRNELTSTPTSSRCNATNSSNKSTIRSSSAKQKLSDKYVLSSMTDYDNKTKNSSSAASSSSVNGESSKTIRSVVATSGSDKLKSVEVSCGGSGRIKINLFDDDQPSTSSGRHNNHHIHNNSNDNDDSKEEEEARVCLKLNDDYMDSANHDLSDDLDPEAEDTWADCEEGSDSEICTCRNDSDDEYGASSSSSEDELPSRDVDLSSYTQLDPISDDILEACDGTPKIQRKRKLTEQSSSMLHVTAESPITTNRKRLALDTITSPHGNLLSPVTSSLTPKSSANLQRTPRLIPTKENPPPELMDWLLTFQRWTNAERLVAVDRLIEQCEPTQVRHMMKVIEPQFQRDFISLLPKELALHVLSYLEPKDLLRAAQTCRSWRFLADDNLLWKEKCKGAGIISESHPDKPKRGRTGSMPKIASPWKAAYMRHHTIETNWRSNPIRTPKVLNGHDDHVITCLQFSGNRIVSGSDDNTLKVWSAVTGKCLRTLFGHTGGVWSSQMSGNLIISGSTDRSLKIWDADTGVCKHTLYGHTSTVRCMHLHGNKVVSGSRDATLRVWDINTGTCLHILVGHLAAVRCVQYDGKLVVSGAYDYQVKVWNPEKQECLHTLQGHTNRVYSLQFDGVHVVSGSLDTSIRVWDAETGALRHTLMGHQSLTSGMELKNNILVSGNADSTVKVWDIITGQCLATLAGRNKHHSAVTCLQFNNRFVITSSDDGTVKLWDVKTGEFIRNLVALESGGSGGVVWRIRANDTKLICAVGSRNGTEETKLMVLDFDVEGACSKCS